MKVGGNMLQDNLGAQHCWCKQLKAASWASRSGAVLSRAQDVYAARVRLAVSQTSHLVLSMSLLALVQAWHCQ